MAASGRRVTTAVTAKSLRRPLTPDLLRRIDSDPLFSILTADQQNWIDPYTGQAVPAPGGRVQTARDYLLDTGVWKEREPLPQAQLEYERWRYDLMRLIPVEPRLRIFGKDGRGWLNPYNGEIASDIVRDDGKITPRTVSQMAWHLAGCIEARSGRMLDAASLTAKGQALNQVRPTAPQASSRGGTSTELTEDLQKAKNVQQNMLSDLPRIDGYEIGMHYSAHSGVSGDFYEILRLRDGRVLFLLGDVSGHGMQAALVVATALKTLRFLARDSSDLVTLLSRFNDELKLDLLPGQFITCFAGMLDPDSGLFTIVRCGHHPGLVVNLDRDVVLRKVGHKGMAIGITVGPIFAATLRPEQVQLEPGDVLVQYTDGLTEAMDQQLGEFGEARLYASIMAHMEDTTQEFVDGIARDVSAHAGGNLGDDCSILSLVVLPLDEGEEAGEAEAQDPA